MKPCLTCGEPSAASHCEEHAPKPWQHREGSARARGYDTAWDKLSKRARARQPFCSLCFSTENLTTDHLPRAWRRKAEGKAIRLKDVRVLCNDCNVDAGTSRPAEDQGTGALERNSGPGGKAQSRLLCDNPITPDCFPHPRSECLNDVVQHEEDKVAVRADAEGDRRRLGCLVAPGSRVSFEFRPVEESDDHDLHHDRTLS
jgi:5-methylcytosine-specific restriction enzyme A